MRAILLSLTVLAATPANAADRPTPAMSKEAAAVPVFAGDLPDQPYTIIGEVNAGVRKATVFSKASSEAKIYRELWERARKMGTDAVINARYGNSHVSAVSWGKTNASGTAIRFTTPAGG